MDFQSQLAELRDRVERLEQTHRKPRGRTNLVGAARYLNISDTTLRQRHDRGEGPRRVKFGRGWSYTYDDLDEYAQSATT
jgi:hypothetical protein